MSETSSDKNKRKRQTTKPVYDVLKIPREVLGAMRIEAGGGYRVLRKPKPKEND